jgi:hypothetical protein
MKLAIVSPALELRRDVWSSRGRAAGVERPIHVAADPRLEQVNERERGREARHSRLDPQRDALLTAGIAPERIHQDLASGRHDDRPAFAACLKAPRRDLRANWTRPARELVRAIGLLL